MLDLNQEGKWATTHVFMEEGKEGRGARHRPVLEDQNGSKREESN